MTTIKMPQLETIKHLAFDKIPTINYGFFTRNGGVSEGLFSSLNIKYKKGDDPKNVLENKKIIAKHFGLENHYHLIRPYQTHTTKTIILKNLDDLKVFKTDNFDEIQKADAVVTNLKNIVIGVSTADCVPVLLIDEVNKIIGVAHAGWKGARYGILKSTIEAMISLGANYKNIKALIGPCIRQKSYEIDEKFLTEFLAETENNKKFFINSQKQNYYFFDMAKYVKEKLLKQINFVYDVELDTYSDEKRFFSYRRNYHIGETERYGTQFSGIMIC